MSSSSQLLLSLLNYIVFCRFATEMNTWGNNNKSKVNDETEEKQRKENNKVLLLLLLRRFLYF